MKKILMQEKIFNIPVNKGDVFRFNYSFTVGDGWMPWMQVAFGVTPAHSFKSRLLGTLFPKKEGVVSAGRIYYHPDTPWDKAFSCEIDYYYNDNPTKKRTYRGEVA